MRKPTVRNSLVHPFAYPLGQVVIGREDADVTVPVEPGQSWKPMRQLEREHNLAKDQLRYWINTGIIDKDTYVRDAQGPGKPRLVDEYAVLQALERGYGPRKAQVIRAAVIQPATPNEPVIQTPEQVIRPGARITEAVIPQLPADLASTVKLVQNYLAMRELAVLRGELSRRTLELEELYMRKWAAHAPVFPWSQNDVDSYDRTLGTKASRWHAMRYLKTLTLWTRKRYPGAQLPEDIRTGKQKPPRHDVLTPEQERQLLDHIREHSYSLWVYCVTLSRTGARAFEMLDADWDDLTPAGFMTKGRAKKPQGMVYFPRGLYELIKTLPEPHTGPVFRSERGERLNNRAIRSRLRRALHDCDIKFTGALGSYMFRHLFAERMKDRINMERLASIMRTSIEQLEQTYGKHSDDSFRQIIDQAHAEVWGEDFSTRTSSP